MKRGCAMSQADFWYVRFPDGRILRAASTAILRQELDAGHIPLGSKVRRAPSDEWVSLAWTEEFADLVEQRPAPSVPNPEPEARRRKPVARSSPASATPNQSATVGSRLDASRLHLVGVRAYLDELLAALDSTLIAKKLLLGLAAGVVLGGLLALERASWFERESSWLVPAWCLATVGMIVLDFLTGLLTRLTFVELSRLRPAQWSEGLAGSGPSTLQLVLTQMIVGGGAGGLIVLLRWLPHWIGPGPEGTWTTGPFIAAETTVAVGMVLEVFLWPVFFFWWLSPAVLVVEDCSVWRNAAMAGLAASAPGPRVFVSDDGPGIGRDGFCAVLAADRSVVSADVLSTRRTRRRGRRGALGLVGAGLRPDADLLDRGQCVHLSESARRRQQSALKNHLV